MSRSVSKIHGTDFRNQTKKVGKKKEKGKGKTSVQRVGIINKTKERLHEDRYQQGCAVGSGSR